MLQGLVCLLKDTENLVIHSQKLINGYGPATVLDSLLESSNLPIHMPEMDANKENSGETVIASDLELEADLPELPVINSSVNIPSMGLW